MSGSIPSWVTNIESDEKDYQKKHRLTSILIIVIIIAYLSITSKLGDNLSLIITSIIITSILLIFIIVKEDAQKQNLPNLLAANLYRIGNEIETVELSSPSYIKRNQQYLKKCQKLLNDLKVQDHYFIENYITFLKNMDNIILRLNNFYSKKSGFIVFPIHVDLIDLAGIIHANSKNLQLAHTDCVNKIIFKLQEIEPQPLNTFSINKWGKSLNTGWHSLPYFLRAVFTYLFIGIIIFAALSIVMNNVLDMEKSLSNSTASAGTIVLIGALITQIDKIVPKINN